MKYKSIGIYSKINSITGRCSIVFSSLVLPISLRREDIPSGKYVGANQGSKCPFYKQDLKLFLGDADATSK